MDINQVNKIIEKFLNESAITGYNRVELKAADDTIKGEDLAKVIDHTILKADVTTDQVKVVCEEALKYNFASVCVNPVHVKYCAEKLNGSEVKVCTVIGFPLGANTTEIKKLETIDAINNGAQEVDMVINVGKLKDGEYEYVFEDVKAVADAAREKNVVSKVILETCLLTDEEKVIACVICNAAKADFVKTSTGFSTGGATKEDISLMKYVVGNEMSVKASGGVRTQEDAETMVSHGADRIGASASIKIVEGDNTNSGSGY